MRPRIDQKKKALARGISLPGPMARAALEKAIKLDITFSHYIRRLVRADLTKADGE